ncbi:MAG: hypothetical protein E7589_04730, partial [Ruminococcaceae bacterium]|nr:hypothetical protein [Oscillospiraceae bacterium]
YIVPEEGTYYIQNVGSGRYVDVEGPSLNDGAAIHEWDFRTNPQEKWIVEHVANSDGYIRLKSVYSNKYIGIDPDALSYVKQYAVQNNYTLWRIDRTSSGNLTFQCKVYQGTDAVMAVPTASTVNGTNLIMAAYTDNTTYRDEWTLHITKDISLIALPENYNRSDYFPDILGYMDDIGYDDGYHNHDTISEGVTRDELMERLTYSKITLVRTHGSQTSISTSDVSLNRSYLMSCSDDILQYSELIIYGACETAKGGENAENLVAATVEAGARTVIGFEDPVFAGACNRWCKKFFEYYSMYYDDPNYTIEDICIATNEYAITQPNYSGTIDGGTLVTLANYVVAGEKTFP